MRKTTSSLSTVFSSSMLTVLGVVCLAIDLVHAQQSGEQIVNCDPSTSWMNNDDGKTPCTIALNLIAPCSVGSNYTILPLNETNGTTFYNNTLGNQPCTCNTVVYNLISACAVCQGGSAGSFSNWSQECNQSIDYLSYPIAAIANTVHTPKWAFVNISSNGTFDLSLAQDVAERSNHWSTLQIITPIIAVVGVITIGLVAFYFYRRRLHRRYKAIIDSSATPSRSSPPKHSRSESSTSDITKASQSSSSGKSALRRAWTQARMAAPRRLGGLLPDIRTVKSRRNVNGWSIDVEADSERLFPSNPRTSMASERSGPPPNDSPRNSTALTIPQFQQHLDIPVQIQPIHPIQDAADVPVLERPTRGVALGQRLPPVQVVSSGPSKKFNIFDENSVQSPSTDTPESLHARMARSTDEERQDGVLLISRTGLDFSLSSLRTLTEDDEGQRSVDQSNETSTQTYSAGTLPDNSPVLPPSTLGTEDHLLPPSLSRESSSHLNRPERSDPVMLIPQAVRSAGYVASPTSAKSSHSSHYNVPNPYTFNSRQGPNPLRLPPQSKSPFRPSLDLDLAE